MLWLCIITLLLLSVAFTVFFGPPYLPTLKRQTDVALELLDLHPGQTLLELGSGDGRILAAAAKRGIVVVGIELSPVLVAVSWLRTRRYRHNVRIIWGNYFARRWPEADGIFTFMIHRQMGRLDHTIEAWRGDRPVRLASVGFELPGRKPAVQKEGVFLYCYK